MKGPCWNVPTSQNAVKIETKSTKFDASLDFYKADGPKVVQLYDWLDGCGPMPRMAGGGRA